MWSQWYGLNKEDQKALAARLALELKMASFAGKRDLDRCSTHPGSLLRDERTYADIGDISVEEWDRTFRTNIYAPYGFGFGLVVRLAGKAIRRMSVNLAVHAPAV